MDLDDDPLYSVIFHVDDPKSSKSSLFRFLFHSTREENRRRFQKSGPPIFVVSTSTELGRRPGEVVLSTGIRNWSTCLVGELRESEIVPVFSMGLAAFLPLPGVTGDEVGSRHDLVISKRKGLLSGRAEGLKIGYPG